MGEKQPVSASMTRPDVVDLSFWLILVSELAGQRSKPVGLITDSGVRGLRSRQPVARVSAHSAHDAPNINIRSHTRQEFTAGGSNLNTRIRAPNINIRSHTRQEFTVGGSNLNTRICDLTSNRDIVGLSVSPKRQAPNVGPSTFENNVGNWDFCDDYCDIGLNLSPKRQCVRQPNSVPSCDSRLNTPSVSAAGGKYYILLLSSFFFGVFKFVVVDMFLVVSGTTSMYKEDLGDCHYAWQFN
nr:hypothetical protein [Tanacetum cinerariifolium]